VRDRERWAAAWGFDVAGELGNNSTTEAHTPVAVTGLTTGVQP